MEEEEYWKKISGGIHGWGTTVGCVTVKGLN